MKTTPLKKAIHKRLRVIMVVSFLLALILCVTAVSAQTHLAVLDVPKNGTYELQDDTLIVNELRLQDGSTLVLNAMSSSSYIKATRVIVGSNCSVRGTGERGTSGVSGKSGGASKGVCQNGIDGTAGTNGTNGFDGKNLVIEAEEIDVVAAFHIYLKGGTGGDGGAGGNGSAASPSSKHCVSHGGSGGVGGAGGNGGNGGTLSVTYSRGISVNDFCLRVILHNEGGYQGFGGTGGKGGAAGIGASENKSNLGSLGKKGNEGRRGIEGKPLFYSVAMARAN
jgi:hypothetical protein